MSGIKRKKSSAIVRKNDQIRIKSTEERAISALEANQELLNDVQKKILASPVMNGSFDTLVINVENIHKTLDQVHEALYNPDEGVYSRIKMIESVKPQSIEILEKDVIELKMWRSSTENSGIQERSTNVAINEKLEKLTAQAEILKDAIVDLEKTKKMFVSVIKWFLAAFGGAAITLLFTVLYDLMTK
jgi:hypothetical protein